ncbi:MAG: hydrogenase [Oscillospiraceae bacterium]|jgi:nitrogenase molybdenum-iron protein beta chain|nr:hydrogenase [Oscillospiraceae bacterium]
MARTLDQVRYKCALGALQTVQAIERVLPILHAGPGCADKLTAGNGTSGHFAPRIFPCTNIAETEIVFGGEQRLREVVENALRVIDADLYVVLTGCSSEIIGDDTGEVVRGFRTADKPVIYASTAGFKGSNYQGYEWVLEALFTQYLPEEAGGETEKGLVNVFASLPFHDPFWEGNLTALEGLLADIGLTANIIFGYGRGLKHVDRIPRAQCNLVVNPWLGLSSVRLLKERFGTPYLHYPNLPVGACETSKFLRAVGAFAGLESDAVERVIAEKESRYYHYIERYADIFLENRVMAKRFTVAADTQYALALTRFLVNDMGLFPQRQYAMEDVPEAYRADIEGYFRDMNYDIEAEVSFETDGYLVQNEIRGADYHGYPLIVGSAWEKKVARDTNAHFLSIAWPLNERLIINSSYVGYEGGLKFLEDVYSVVLTRFT